MPATKMEIKFSATFRKQYHKVDEKVKKAFRTRLKLFKQDSHNPLLRNHQLMGKYQNYRSINVTGDWRALYREQNENIHFELLGTHSQLYK